MIVLDLGCYEHGSLESCRLLAQRFQPDALFAFDPHPGTQPLTFFIDGIPCSIERKAAWIWDGQVTYEPDGVASTLIHRNEPCLPDHMRLEPQPRIMADCFDLEQWILDRVPLDDPCVVKMDIEGAEYPLLNHLILQDNAIWRIQYLLVEWHGNERRRWRLEDRLREVGMTVEGWAH